MATKRMNTSGAKAIPPPPANLQPQARDLNDLGGALSSRWNTYLMGILIAAVPDEDERSCRARRLHGRCHAQAAARHG